MSFRFHMKPVLAKPKVAAKPRAPEKAPAAAKVLQAEKAADDEAPAVAPPQVEPATAPVERPPPTPTPPVGRTRTLSYRSQDESASSADEARKSKVVSRLVKARIKPNIPGVKKTPIKIPQTPEAAVPPSVGKTISENPENRVPRQSVSTPVAVRTGPDFKPSPHLVPAAPNSVPDNVEISSSEDEGVIDPYNPDHPLGHRENPEKCKGTKSPWIMKKFRSGVPTAMIDYLFYNPKGNPMVHDDDRVLEPEKAAAEKEEDVDDPEEEEEPRVAAPQLKLGPDGKFILDDTSLIVETTAAREGRKAMQTGVGPGIFKRKSNRTTWTDEETLFFYKCLRSVGTDFAMMTTFFPHRTRHQIKLKFKLEEKRNPTLIDKALVANAHYDVTELQKEFLEVSEKAVSARSQKRKPREPKPRQKKSADKTKKPRKRGKKDRKDYFYEGGSASDEGSSSDDENDVDLRREMIHSMGDEISSKKPQSRKKQPAAPLSADRPRIAYVDVVANPEAIHPSALHSRILNPNALSSSQVNQLMSQRPEREQLRYGNSELAFLLNSPTIREKENEKRRGSPPKSTAVRRINLDETTPTTPERPQVAPSEEAARPAVEQIRQLLNKRQQETPASSDEPPPERRKSVNVLLEDPDGGGILEEEMPSEEDEDGDEMESIAHALSRPTKSGRLPKVRSLQSEQEQPNPKPKRPRKAVPNVPKKPRRRSKSNSKESPTPPEVDLLADTTPEEATEHIDMRSLLANVEPGALVVFKSSVPNDPSKEMVQVFMVPPPNQSGSTIAHNLDGSVSQLTIGGVDVPLIAGTKITPAPLIPVVAATTCTTFVHSQQEGGLGEATGEVDETGSRNVEVGNTNEKVDGTEAPRDAMNDAN